MSFSSSTISIGDSTKKADYDRLMANTVAIKNETISFAGSKTFSGSVAITNSLTSTTLDVTSTATIDVLYMTGRIYPKVPTAGSMELALSETFVLPRGIWQIAFSGDLFDIRIYASGGWKTMCDGNDDNGALVFSDGTNTKIVNTHGLAAQTFYYHIY